MAIRKEMAQVTMQYKGLYFRANKNGTFTVKSKNFGKEWKAVVVTFGEATDWLYNMAANNDIGNEMCEKLCRKFNCDVYGSPINGGYLC